jgi:hypothetical protein
VELWYLHQQTGLEFSGTPEPRSVIQIIGNLPIAGAPDTKIARECWIFSESTVLNNLQSIAKENRYQLLDFPETDPALYISNHPGIERLSMTDRVDVSYPEPRLTYFRLT